MRAQVPCLATSHTENSTPGGFQWSSWNSATRRRAKCRVTKLYGLTTQIRRAAVSIPSNVAEGYSRRKTKVYALHVGIALGSHGEIETCLEIAARLGLLPTATCDALASKLNAVGRAVCAIRLSRKEDRRGGKTSEVMSVPCPLSPVPCPLSPVPPVPCPLSLISSKHIPRDKPHIRRTLGEPAHVPGEPVLAVRDQHANAAARLREALLQRTLDAVQHRVLVRRARHAMLVDERPSRSTSTGSCVAMCSSAARAAAHRRLSRRQRERVVVLVHVGLARVCNRRAARDTRPSPSGSPSRAAPAIRRPAAVRYRYACSAMPIRGDRARVRRNRSSVGSTYGELSMSIQTKLLRARRRDRPAAAGSGSRAPCRDRARAASASPRSARADPAACTLSSTSR